MNYHRLQRHRAAMAVLLLAGACAAAAAAKKEGASGAPGYGVAVYSDLCRERETGDIGGQRISLHRFAEGDTLLYELTAGALSEPVVASEVQIDAGTGVLTFVYDGQGDRQHTVLGRFSRDGETLTLAGGYCADQSQPMRLSKVRDFRRKLDDCRACPAPKLAPQEPAAVAPQAAEDDDAPMMRELELPAMPAPAEPVAPPVK